MSLLPWPPSAAIFPAEPSVLGPVLSVVPLGRPQGPVTSPLLLPAPAKEWWEPLLLPPFPTTICRFPLLSPLTVVAAEEEAIMARFFSEPELEAESASMHSEASSGSLPEPDPEAGPEMEGQTGEVLSLQPSTRTFPQLLLLSLHGELELQGEFSYCESRPG